MRKGVNHDTFNHYDYLVNKILEIFKILLVYTDYQIHILL